MAIRELNRSNRNLCQPRLPLRAHTLQTTSRAFRPWSPHIECHERRHAQHVLLVRRAVDDPKVDGMVSFVSTVHFRTIA